MRYGTSAIIVVTAIIGLSGTQDTIHWLKRDNKSYTLNYTTADISSIEEYQNLVSIGLNDVERFFDDHYKNKFEVFIYPNRSSLDSTWKNDWKIPDFKSECWMVASGVSKKIDILSPRVWDTESCEHSYSKKEETQRLVTHELVHVFHAQVNISPDFSDVTNMDWFVEGLAAYASGQCDSNRVREVVNAIKSEAVPVSVDQFWTGKLRYALSGTMAMYIDKKYGRNRLKKLLVFNHKQEVLQELATTETDLLAGWKDFMLLL